MERDCGVHIRKLVECARSGAAQDAALQAHLGACPVCRARWEDELRLTATLRAARETAFERAPAPRRDELMRAFAAGRRRAFYTPAWLAVAAAAVLIFSVALAYALRQGSPASLQIARHNAGVTQSGPEAEVDDWSNDESGFVAVPYAPPLAAGEFVSVVRAEFQPVALARMGIYVEATPGSEVPADVLVGEDGTPRAVRLIDAVPF